MASALRKEEIRRNPLAELLGQVLRFVQANRTVLLVGVLAVCVAGAAAVGYWWYRTEQEKSASRALVDALTAARVEQPGGQPNVDAALKRLREVAQEYRGTPGAEEALIILANAQVDAEKLEDALASFTEYLSVYRSGRFTVMAGLGKAYIQESKGDLEGASRTLVDILDRQKNDPLMGEVLLTLGRVYADSKRRDDAMRTYGSVVDRFGQTFWAKTAVRRMEVLKAK